MSRRDGGPGHPDTVMELLGWKDATAGAVRRRASVARARLTRPSPGGEGGHLPGPTGHLGSGRARGRSSAAAVELRPLARGDESSLLEIFAGLGPRSRRLRFLTPKPRLTPAELRRLADVDQHDHVAILASSAASGRPVGVGRFVREPEDGESADVALAVVDAWQSRGVGTLLAQELSARALMVGVRRFTLAMEPGNEAVLRLLERSGGAVSVLSAGPQTLELAVALGA
jgi:RimJ/RimL family protein N-acetyltransferase